jgi:epimerase transport system membrane fusion protein
MVETGIERPRQIGLGIAFLVFGVFGLWAALAPIDGAAFAPGIIRVGSYNKVVQHLEGGIVKSINVRGGDHVRAGDVLLVMDSTQSQAQLEILNGQLLTALAFEARLMAERNDMESVDYPPQVSAAGQSGTNEITVQNQIFKTRKAARESSIAVLEQRIEQLQSRIGGLRALQASKTTLATSYEEELEDIQALLDEGFADKQRLRELERSFAAASGEAADLRANIASAEIQIGETRLQIIQTENEFQNDVANQLAEVQNQLKDIRERITANSDIVSRTDVRAPIDGIVNNLQVHTEGAVLSPGSAIAEIVPQGEELIIEASVAPIDIDRVSEGLEAMVRMSSFNGKRVPTLYGTVETLSADAITDPNSGASYYSARIALTPESIDDLEGLELVPGMPAEVHIATGSRTFLQYIMKPLSNAAARGLRED